RNSVVMFSRSTDRGSSWSKAIVISEHEAARESAGLTGGDAFLPSVAVNREGVVGVAWYDSDGFERARGWNYRFRASTDGGSAWTPGVRVSEEGTSFDEAT